MLAAMLAPCAFAQPAAYDQPYRPQYHFSPREHWTNDPNGLVYFDGEYHLFYQFNPLGDMWGHMSWGHAVSRDLVHWRELPVALPEAGGIMVFTGSTVVDEHNTSGFCAGGKPCLVAVYTGHTPSAGGRAALQTQNLAYSNDRGRTWVRYSGNPVLDLHLPDFRDPDVFWSEQGRRWVMVVALPNEHKVLLYGSPNLKEWQRLSEFGPAGATGGQWECPILTRVPVEGGSTDSRWILKVGLNPGGLQGGSGEQYFIGDFDGARFTNANPATTTLWTDYGKDCYCALTFNGMPPGASPVMIGWMNNWQYASKVPTSPWRGQMTVPRTLTLRQTADGLRLFQAPADALDRLRLGHFSWQGRNIAGLNRALGEQARGNSLELWSEVSVGSAAEVGFKVFADESHYTTVGYRNGELFVDRTRSGVTSFSPSFPARTAVPLAIGDKPLQLTILLDRSTVEVFGQSGRVALTNLAYPPAGAHGIEFYANGGSPGSIRVDVWPLRSAWK
jgi:fructan beta-fructosidase